MNKLERADRLKTPPVVGRQYLVPAILWDRHYFGYGVEGEENILMGLQNSRSAQWLPVWGRKHDDIEFFSFPYKHYHIDPRFLNKRQWSDFSLVSERTPLQYVQGQPLSHSGLPSGPAKPVLRKMRCTMAHSVWGHDGAESVLKMNKAFSGRQCAKGKHGFVCPHQLFPLGSVQAIDGVVTCPLHGLRINAETGVVL